MQRQSDVIGMPLINFFHLNGADCNSVSKIVWLLLSRMWYRLLNITHIGIPSAKYLAQWLQVTSQSTHKKS